MSKRRSLAEIRPVLEALARTEAIIIGGQAVNLWAERYQKETAPWIELRPYTSFDLDVLGSRSDVLKCSEALDAEPFLPLPGENTVNSGKVITELGGSAFEVDFVNAPNGLSAAEIRELAREVKFESLLLRVLHPLHCVESKVANLATLSQDAGNRQDLKHLRLSVAILHEYLGALTINGSSDETLLRWAHRLRMDSNHEFGLQAFIRYGISLQSGIPFELWRERQGVLGLFIKQEWDAWTTEIAEKAADLREIDAWVESLKNKTT
jgi:hypothetical protein